MIESIRICNGKLTIFCNFFPSANPVLKGNIPDKYDKLKIAYESYRKWWDEVKTLKQDDAANINPLEHTGLTW